jgi:hypothetical protein
VHIQGLVQLVGKEFRFLLLLEQLFLQQKNLPTQVWDAGGLVLRDDKEAFEL